VTLVYPSIRSPELVREPGTGAPARRGWLRVGPNIYGLGFTSLVTDISSEMITAIIPIYLVVQLGASPFEFGVFNGISQGALGVLAIAFAVLTDRRRRYKETAFLGYGISSACKLGLLAVGTAPLPAAGVLLVDRAGKGIRTSPRDALISLSAAPRRVAEAFGVHRALDTTGALLGPVVAFLVLDGAPHAYDAVFVMSFAISLVGLLILAFFVHNVTPPVDWAPRIHAPSWQSLGELLRMPRVRAVAIAACLLGLVTVGDAFVYLTLQDRAGFVSSYFPLLYVGTALGYLVLAIPLGSLADRIGPNRVFLAGYGALAAAYALLLVHDPGPFVFVAVLGLLGVFYAATDGVLAALISKVVPTELRTTGLALLTTLLALSRFAASAAFGATWSWKGADTAITVFVIAAAIAIVVSTRLLRTRRAVT
jgi:MFS family permease